MRKLMHVVTMAVTFFIAGFIGQYPGDAYGRPSSSSGGYSRPSSGGGGWSSRTPSSGGGWSSRTPSTSGGYGRPSSPSSSGGYFGGSSSDRALSRQNSREALDSYRFPPERDVYTRRPQSVPSGPWDGMRRRDPMDDVLRERSRWQQSQNWRIPSYIPRTNTHYGAWDGLFLWSLLDSLSRPGHSDFFHHHQYDPDYQAWRAEAESRAATDPEIRTKLNELDRMLAEKKDQPRSRDYLPPDASPEIANHMPTSSSGDEEGGSLIFLLLICGLIAYFGWRYMASDLAAKKKGLLQNPMKKAPYQPKWFRVGMTLPVDPSLFILAGDATHVRAPETAGNGSSLSVESVGVVESPQVSWHRLYLQGENYFFQVHLDAQGNPDECRYFSILDEVNPANRDEWAFWLDEQEGMLGWPEFQTKDGRVYRRIWSSGMSKVPPRSFDESITSTGSEKIRSHQAMLYGVATGAAAPAPETEYILLDMIEEGKAAWIAIYAGMDVSVSSLNLS